jgi:hypothetical protein
VQRRLLGLLFVALAVGLALVAVFAALEGGSAWVIALAAAALAVWLGDLGRRALGRRRAWGLRPLTAYSLAVATADPTQSLWQEYRKSQDQDLRDRLILTYAPLVKFVAGRVGASLPSQVDEQDLV